MNGIYFYKLQSEYPNDVTKNCKLTINEIDSNFKFLEDKDISAFTFNRDTKQLILTRNNGEILVADLSDVTYDLNVTYDEGCGIQSGATLTISYDGVDGKQTVVVDKLVTVDNLKDVIGSDILTKVITDDTLKGNGTLNSPLSINKSYETGMYGPVEEVIDTTKGEVLPEGEYGAKYLTKELVNDYGYLYNYEGLTEVENHLSGYTVSGQEDYCWHVPSKAEWDALLNSLEDCVQDQTHGQATCHTNLGRLAGKRLKAACSWKSGIECTCNGNIPSALSSTYCPTDIIEGTEGMPSYKVGETEGTDTIGFSAYAVGWATKPYNTIQYNSYGTQASFWTTTPDASNNYYTKTLNDNNNQVWQDVTCPDNNYLSIRLVKKYNGSNYYGSEIINGKTYDTILVPETGQIWLAQNVSDNLNNENCLIPNGGQGIGNTQRQVYYINTWNGSYWDRKELSDGDTIVVNYCGEGQDSNIEYRVYYDTECNATLVDTNDVAVNRTLAKIKPLIDAETSARTEADKYISGVVDNLSTVVSENSLNIEALKTIARYHHEKIDALSGEIESISSAVTGITSAITQEAEERKAADAFLQDEITEISGDVQALSACCQDCIDSLLSGGTYTIYAETSGLNIPSKKEGKNDIKINFDGDFGILKVVK